MQASLMDDPRLWPTGLHMPMIPRSCLSGFGHFCPIRARIRSPRLHKTLVDLSDSSTPEWLPFGLSLSHLESWWSPAIPLGFWVGFSWGCQFDPPRAKLLGGSDV